MKENREWLIIEIAGTKYCPLDMGVDGLQVEICNDGGGVDCKACWTKAFEELDRIIESNTRKEDE